MRVPAVSLLVATLAWPAAAATRGPGDWADDDRGIATAARLIEACVKTSRATQDANHHCINAAFDLCTRENGGRMSQRDLNDCRKYSYRAWTARYDKAIGQFETVLRTWSQPSAEGWKKATAERFRRQEDEWRRWTRADCEMWELGSVGGTIHSYAVATCMERHLALRTVSLSPYLEWLAER